MVDEWQAYSLEGEEDRTTMSPRSPALTVRSLVRVGWLQGLVEL